MTSPQEIDAQIDRIINTARGFVEAGPAADDFSAQHRRHFLLTATRMLDSWHANDPCPIAFANLYARQTVGSRELKPGTRNEAEGQQSSAEAGDY